MRVEVIVVSVSVLIFPLLTAANQYETASHHQTEVQVSDISIAESVDKAAARWSLTQEEYVRYLGIVKGPLGRWNKNIDPVLALGIYATNETEQRKYAELYARQEYELTVRTQAFEQAYHDAFEWLYPKARIVDKRILQNHLAKLEAKKQSSSLSASSIQQSTLQSGDRLLFFADMQCVDCGEQLNRIKAAFDRVAAARIDVYVVNAVTEKEVRRWAVKNQINPDWVNGQQVTLNLDEGLYQRVDAGRKSRFYLKRGERVFLINKWQLGL